MQLAKQPMIQRLCSWVQFHKAETQTIVWLAIPVSASFLVNKALSFVSVVFVGHLGPADLAAASLGSSLSNVIGNSVLAGLAGAMSTLCGQVQYYSDPLPVITLAVGHRYAMQPSHDASKMSTHQTRSFLYVAFITASPILQHNRTTQPDCVSHTIRRERAEV